MTFMLTVLIKKSYKTSCLNVLNNNYVLRKAHHDLHPTLYRALRNYYVILIIVQPLSPIH